MKTMSSDRCYRCENPILANAQFCTRCAFPLTFEKSASISGSEWTANANHFAVRIRPENLKGWFGKGVKVDESQTGLLFKSGRFEHELTPGRQELESLPDRIRGFVTGDTASAVLIRRGLFPLNVLGTALTPEADTVSFDCELGLKVGDRNTFYVNLMQSSDQVTSGDLMQRFAGITRQAIFSVIATCGGAELLNVHPELQQKMVDAVADAVGPVAVRWGMAIRYVSPPSFSNKQLAQFQLERAQMVRELRSEKLKQQFAEDKDKIEIRRFQAARVLADAKIKDAIESAERTGEFDKVKAELRHSQHLHGLQLQETMEAAVDSFSARQRDRTEKNEDHTNLRAHLLAATDIERQQELANLKFEFRKQSLSQQLELDDLTREQRTKVAREELRFELERLESTQIGQIDRDRRQRQAQRDDRLADAEVGAKTSQVVGDAHRDKSSKDFDELHRRRLVGHDQTLVEKKTAAEIEADRIERLSQVQAGHLGRLQEVQKKELENKAFAAQATHGLTEESKDREHKRKMEELQLLKDSPEMMQLLKMAELAVHSPVMSQAFADVMKMMMAKGMTGEQLEQVMASQSPDVAKALQEKYRTQAEVARAQEAMANDFTKKLSQVEKEGLERIISELKSGQSLNSQQMSDIFDRLERSGTKGQELLRDVGVASGSRPEKSDNSMDPRLMEKLLERITDLLR